MKKLFRIFLSFILIGLLFYSCKNESRTNVLERGVLDLRDIDFDKNSLLSLDGEWEFYWRQFLNSNFEYINEA